MMNNDFGKSAGAVPNSRGTILSDYNGTLNTLKDNTKFCSELFICLVAWKNSGYDVILHTMSPSTSVDGSIELECVKHGLKKDFFNPDLDRDFSHDILIDKRETDGLDAIAIFDDEVLNRKGATAISLDVNDPHVRQKLRSIAADYEASGRTKVLTFNPADFAQPEIKIQSAPAVVPA